MPSLIQHQKSTKHCPCPRCDPFDSYEELLEAHLSPINKYPCPKCRKRFPHTASLEAHQHENLHGYCLKCNILSPTRQIHNLHMQSHYPIPAKTPASVTQSSVTQFRCCDCDRDFKREKALAAHLRFSKVHGLGKGNNKKKKEGDEEKQKEKLQVEGNQRKCKKCDRTFKTRDALQKHLSSVRHNPLSDIKCIADANCSKKFNCPSAQLHHLESGRCISKMTKEKLNAAIVANDPGRIISSGGIMAEWLLDDKSSTTSTSSSRIGSPVLTPTSTEFSDYFPSSGILTPTSSLSTTASLDSLLTLRPRTRGGSQRCPLCPPSCTRVFRRGALEQHLASSVHAQVSMSMPLPVPDKISFHCPRALMGGGSKEGVVKQFSTVSGLAQHLESGACDGGRGTFRRVVEYVQEEMSDMGFSGLKLLS